MMLSKLLIKENISFDQDLSDRQTVFQYLTAQLYATGYLNDEQDFLDAVNYRESLSETGLGDGIAIPHGKSESVLKPGIAFVRLKKGIPWPSLDNKPIQYVFLLAIPFNDDNNDHIKMMSELARSLIREEVVRAVHNANDSESLIKKL